MNLKKVRSKFLISEQKCGVVRALGAEMAYKLSATEARNWLKSSVIIQTYKGTGAIISSNTDRLSTGT